MNDLMSRMIQLISWILGHWIDLERVKANEVLGDILSIVIGFEPSTYGVWSKLRCKCNPKMICVFIHIIPPWKYSHKPFHNLSISPFHIETMNICILIFHQWDQPEQNRRVWKFGVDLPLFYLHTHFFTHYHHCITRGLKFN